MYTSLVTVSDRGRKDNKDETTILKSYVLAVARKISKRYLGNSGCFRLYRKIWWSVCFNLYSVEDYWVLRITGFNAFSGTGFSEGGLGIKKSVVNSTLGFHSVYHPCGYSPPVTNTKLTLWLSNNCRKTIFD